MESQDYIKSVTKTLRPIAKVENFSGYDQYAFCMTFARFFAHEVPNFNLGNGFNGATRSNWTYHTSHAMAKTATIFEFDCKFECNGKRDAVIETRDEDPEILLFAEWEWDYHDVFGKGKELEKLRDSCRATDTADAFLLVYSPIADYPKYLFDIVTYWQKAFSRKKTPPALFINTIVFNPNSSWRDILSLNSLMVHDSNVQIMSDLLF